ncbi:hypothetical protein ACOMHN_052009 [Nucella lapillus]
MEHYCTVPIERKSVMEHYCTVPIERKSVMEHYCTVPIERKSVMEHYCTVPIERKSVMEHYCTVPIERKSVMEHYCTVPIERKSVMEHYCTVPIERKSVMEHYCTVPIERKSVMEHYCTVPIERKSVMEHYCTVPIERKSVMEHYCTVPIERKSVMEHYCTVPIERKSVMEHYCTVPIERKSVMEHYCTVPIERKSVMEHYCTVPIERKSVMEHYCTVPIERKSVMEHYCTVPIERKSVMEHYCTVPIERKSVMEHYCTVPIERKSVMEHYCTVPIERKSVMEHYCTVPIERKSVMEHYCTVPIERKPVMEHYCTVPIERKSVMEHYCTVPIERKSVMEHYCTVPIEHPTVSPRQPESRLMHKLLAGYDPEVRPLTNLSATINVHVSFTPIRIDDLVRAPYCMHGMFVSHDKTHYSKAQACSDGVVRYVIMENYAVSCDVDINFFPFDRQTCSLQVMSWYHPRGEVLLQARAGDMDGSHYEEDGEWVLLRTGVNLTVYYSAGPHHGFAQADDDVFSLVVFSLTMLRRPMYYVVNVLLPCGLLCVLVLINFFLPPDSGEKVSLGITVLLAFTVFQLLIAEIVPTSADTTPKLAIFLLCIMATSTSSIIISVLVLDLHHRAVCTQPPVWLRRLVLDLLARLMCMRNSHVTRHVVQPHSPDSKECPSPAVCAVCDAQGNKTAAGTKFRLTVDDSAGPVAGESDSSNANRLKMAASDFRLNLQSQKSDTDYRPLTVTGGSEHRLGGMTRLTMTGDVRRANDVRRVGSSEVACQSLIINPDSLHSSGFPFQTRSTQRLIHSINTLTTQAAGGGGVGGATDAGCDQKRCQSQQEFVRAVREVYHELRNTRRSTEWEHALESEWKMMARVVDRLFFWITFFALALTSLSVFTSLIYV